MKSLNIQLEINSNLHFKNPDSSDLGRSIISKSIVLIDKIGFEAFTFKKLGVLIESPESSIYRYFKNKHLLLIYLTSWYWAWTEYRIIFATTNISSSKEKLLKSIEILTKPVLIDNSFSHINEVILSKIIFSESIKTYHTINVDEENRKGFFKAYENVVKRVSDIVLEFNPDCSFSHMLISTVIEGAHQQKYFADHIPALTNKTEDENIITVFYTKLIFNFLK